MNIRSEVETARFGDKRLTARLVRIAEQIAKGPDQSFPKAARSDAALEATYRFLGNESVTPAAILQPHVTATAARCAQAGAVFVAHDSCSRLSAPASAASSSGCKSIGLPTRRRVAAASAT
jgi:hypothetical protein